MLSAVEGMSRPASTTDAGGSCGLRHVFSRVTLSPQFQLGACLTTLLPDASRRLVVRRGEPLKCPLPDRLAGSLIAPPVSRCLLRGAVVSGDLVRALVFMLGGWRGRCVMSGPCLLVRYHSPSSDASPRRDPLSVCIGIDVFPVRVSDSPSGPRIPDYYICHSPCPAATRERFQRVSVWTMSAMTLLAFLLA